MYGIVPLSDKEIISTFTKNGIGTVVGYSLYNALNLTTQVAKTIEILSSKTEQNTKKIRNIVIHQIKIDYTENVVKLIHCLEVLKNFNDIQDLNIKSFIIFTKEFIDWYDDEIFAKVISTINYKKSTIAFLQEILNFYGVKNNLNIYLSSLSKYKYPKMEKIYEIARV